MHPSASILVATALAITPISDDAIAKWWSAWWRGVGGAISRIFSRPSPPPKAPTVAPRRSPPASAPIQSVGVATRVAIGSKRTLDIVAPKSDFMRHYLAIRWGIAGAQYLAITPDNLALIADAQYRTMLDRSQVLPENHPITQRVRQITDQLVKAVQFDPSISNELLHRMKWELHVIQSDVVNAFCMPGGKMVMYTGIIDRLRLTDDEIAVIMGHEIAHALREHSYTRIKTQLATNAAISAVWAYTGRHMYAFDIANSLWQLSHSRDHEREADHDGLDIARMAGYDPCAGSRVWAKMRQLSKSSPPEFLSTHPDSTERQDTLLRQAWNVGGKCER